MTKSSCPFLSLPCALAFLGLPLLTLLPGCGGGSGSGPRNSTPTPTPTTPTATTTPTPTPTSPSPKSRFNLTVLSTGNYLGREYFAGTGVSKSNTDVSFSGQVPINRARITVTLKNALPFTPGQVFTLGQNSSVTLSYALNNSDRNLAYWQSDTTGTATVESVTNNTATLAVSNWLLSSASPTATGTVTFNGTIELPVP